MQILARFPAKRIWSRLSPFSSALGPLLSRPSHPQQINISVWWDYTSCPVPDGTSSFKIFDTIVSALHASEIYGTVSMRAFGMWQHLPASTQDALLQSGITLVHVNQYNNHGTRDSLTCELSSWVAQHPPPAHLLFVSNDVGMASTLHRLRNGGYNVLLSCTNIRSKASLYTTSTLLWPWTLLAKGVDLTPQHINLPPTGVNWSYGVYAKRLISEPLDHELMEERVGATISQSALDNIRRVLQSHPNGISIRMLRQELKLKDLKKRSYRKFVSFLKSMPKIFELLRPLGTNDELYVALVKKVEGSAEPKSNEQDVEDCSESVESGFGNSLDYEVEHFATGESDKGPSEFVSGFFGFEASDNIFKEDTKFELELLEHQLASYEMVGKGTLGTVHRLLLDDGRVLALKALEVSNPCPSKDFYRFIDLIGHLRHPNVVSLRAFYYMNHGLFLIYDFFPNGTLHSCIHANRGPGREPLDWTARLRLLFGAARGLSWIHQEYGGIPHGSIKSCNILIGQNHEACVSDFGMPLLSPTDVVIAHLGGYMAPEQVESNKFSLEADVYGFGILILEVLTGRVPTQCLPLLLDSTSQKKHTKSVGVASVDESDVGLVEWVRLVMREEGTGGMLFDLELLRYKDIEVEIISMLNVGLACVNQLPDKRPTMSEVVKLIEDLWVEEDQSTASIAEI